MVNWNVVMCKVGRINVAALAIGLTAALGTSIVAPASAQDRFEANTRGNFGGYSTFGGYYDTFGGYGGISSYGYRRYDKVISPTATFASVPTLQPGDVGTTCAWLKQRAKETGSRKWRARYSACRSGN